MNPLSDYIVERIKIDNVDPVIDFRDPYFQIRGKLRAKCDLKTMEFDETADDWYGCVVNWYNGDIGCPGGETLFIWSVSLQTILAFIPRKGQLHWAWIFFCEDKSIPKDPDEARKTFGNEKEFNEYFYNASELYYQIYSIKHSNSIEFLSPKLQEIVDDFCRSSSN